MFITRLTVIVLCLSLFAGFLTAQSSGPVETGLIQEETDLVFYVSANGNDTWSGRRAFANSDGTDGPFASFGRAVEAVRRVNLAMDSDITVMFLDGTYSLDERIVMTERDSGMNGYRVVYRNYPGHEPVFSAGRRILDWQKAQQEPAGLAAAAQGQLWMGKLPAGVDHAYCLFEGEKELPRARSEGFLPVQGPNDPKRSNTEMHYPEGNVLDRLETADGVELVIRPWALWVMNILPLARVDTEQRIAYTAVPGTYFLTKERHGRFGEASVWVENSPVCLDEPGEWFCDAKQGVIYYWPEGGRPGEDVVVPGLMEMVFVGGDEAKKEPVRNVFFEGLTFMHSRRDTMADSDIGLQHDWEFYDKANGMMRFRWAENCGVRNCLFTCGGSGGLRLDLYCRGMEVWGNEVSNLGGTGIGLIGYGPGTMDVNTKNRVVNNHIHNIGQKYWHCSAIHVWQSSHNLISHNLIHDVPYNAVTFSGVMPNMFAEMYTGQRELARTIRWDECGLKPGQYGWDDVLAFLHTRSNLFEYNEIHHALDILGDGNGVYMRMCPPGNTIRRNYFHDIYGEHSAGAIRMDDDQWGTYIAENVIDRCTAAGIALKAGNAVENNVISNIFTDDDPLNVEGAAMRGYIVLRPSFGQRGEVDHKFARVTRNVFVHTREGEPVFYDDTREWDEMDVYIRDVHADYNVFYWPGGGEGKLEEMLAGWREEGIDRHSVIAAEGFGSIASGWFDTTGTAAEKVGFKPIDLAGMGLRDDFPTRLRERMAAK